MRVSNASDKGNVGSGHEAEIGNFTRRVHSHFLNGDGGICRQCGERQWNANMVVETGFVGMAAAHTSQNMRQHFLATGFADRSSNANQTATF